MPDPIPAAVVYGIYLYLALVCAIGVSMQVWIRRGRRRTRSPQRTERANGPESTAANEYRSD